MSDPFVLSFRSRDAKRVNESSATEQATWGQSGWSSWVLRMGRFQKKTFSRDAPNSPWEKGVSFSFRRGRPVGAAPKQPLLALAFICRS